MARYVVRVRRGGPWDWSRDMSEQAGWDERARYMANGERHVDSTPGPL